ncbi:hypothetical protein PG999_005668 [Apiospora kogelbergensis]|uniref:BZIP domain-containing protein n=1 Tax=Apiospora kogelbergensis TaxID=1337665 RepID=A0AAW0R2V6_9PEZI
MRVMGPDLAILSAERYDDGLRAQRAASHGPATATKRAPGKRARKQPSVDQDEPDEEKKRARGRPRLDTTDQTPQEAGRRRTQIRLAQRAYRDRKESAITNLEREVESLKATNGQMTQAYQDVLNYAASNGLLDAKSELGRRLLRLEALASKSNDVYDDYDSFSPDGGNEDMQLPSDQRRQSEPSVSSGENVNSSGSSVSQASVKPDSTQPLWAGVMVSHEPVGEADAPRAPPLYPTLYGGPGSHPPGPTGYEIIAQPTSQNASFAPQLSFDPSYGMSSWAPSPWASLPSPSTLAYQEPSFARRLHRSALQRAAHLVTMKNPPSETVLRVFGFARLFETLEQIRERTLGLLTRSERESLSHQEYPFQHLGGMGTHFPAAERGEHMSPVSRGLPARPKDDYPFTMGPMDPRVGKIRETLINLPGFDGQFWDPDEVQIYLMHNGVEIPPAVDHHVVELENGAFGDPPLHTQGEDDRPQFAGRPTPCSTMSSEAAGTGTSAMCHFGHKATVLQATFRLWALPPLPLCRYSLLIPSRPPMRLGFLWEWADRAIPAIRRHKDIPVLPEEFCESTWISSCIVSTPDSRFYLLTSFFVVPSLTWDNITELLIKMTCLGRSPGIRPKDVDLAFWASVTDPSPA